jgi:hypothetical protein
MAEQEKPKEDTPKGLTCSGCHTPMERGYVPDIGSGTVLRWVKGVPQPRKFLGGTKLDVAAYKVAPGLQAWRCATCGRVEFFTLPSGPGQG